MEIVLLFLFTLGFLAVVSIDTIQKRRRDLTSSK